MLWLRVLVAVLAVVAAAEEAYDYDFGDPANIELMEAILEAGEAAIKLMDFETFHDFLFVHRKIVCAAKKAEMGNIHRTIAVRVAWFIKREIEAGKIQLKDIKAFIDFFNSGKMDKFLTTWDFKVITNP